MPFEDLEKYVELISQINPQSVVLIGGEPSLYPNLEELLDLLHKKKLNVSIVSNGIKFSDLKFTKSVLSKINNLTFSVEGTKDVHNRIVNNNNAYDFLLQAINNVNIIAPKMLNTNTVISKENINNILDCVDELYSMGVRRFGFNVCTSFCRDNMSYSPREFTNHFVPLLRNLIQKYPEAKFKVVTPVPKCLVPPDLNKYFNFGCHIFSDSGLILDVDGKIILCTHWAEKPLAKISSKINLLEFEELWKEIGTYRRKLSKRPLVRCGGCKDKDNCFGGCPIFWQQVSPEQELSLE